LSEAPRTRLAATLALLAATALVAASTAITEGTAPARADEDAEEVALMLEERCYRCHGPDKQKSGLRFDLVEDLRKVIVPRAAPDSELFRRIALPIDAEDAMPPKGPRVSEDRLLAVLRWINAGALFPITEEQELESTGERTRELALIERVRRESGARVLALRGGAQEDALLVDFSLADASPGEAGVRSLDPIAGRIVELSLAGRDVSSGIATKFPSLPALERLHLERTGVDDAALEALVQRPLLKRSNSRANPKRRGNSTASTNRAPLPSAASVSWPAAWWSAACASSSCTREADTTTTTGTPTAIW